jgi:DNA-directed RNA polymerase subunit RPC12/RpoP
MGGTSRPRYHAWEYFDLDGYLRASNPVAAAILRIAKTLGLVASVTITLPAAFFHPILAPFGLCIIGLALWAGARRYGVWHGDCPRCGQEVWIAAKRHGTKTFDCRICRNRLLLKSGRFLSVAPDLPAPTRHPGAAVGNRAQVDGAPIIGVEFTSFNQNLIRNQSRFNSPTNSATRTYL